MHTLICGVTQSGKTTLAHKLAQDFNDAGHRIVVYDPVGTPTAAGGWPTSAVQFDDADEFLEYMKIPEVMHCHVFIDEASDIFSIGQKDNFWLLTRGRHFGFTVYLIAQRPKLIAPSARTQCGRLYLFRLAVDDAHELGRDFGINDLHKISLDRGDFLVIESGKSDTRSANIFEIN